MRTSFQTRIRSVQGAGRWISQHLHYIGVLLVAVVILRSHQTMKLSEKTLQNTVQQQEALRDILWVNLLTQRTAVLAISPSVTGESEDYQRASQIADAVSPFLERARSDAGASPDLVATVESLFDQVRSPEKFAAGGTTAKRKLLKDINELGIALNADESKRWYALLDETNRLVEDIHRRRREEEGGYALLIFFLASLAWVSYQRRQAEAALKQSETRLIHAAKMSALGEMAGGVAHEINTPLGTIRLVADQMRELLDDEPLNRGMLVEMSTKISTTVQRISAIVTGLRVFSRDGSQDHFVEASVSQIAEETLILCQERLKNSDVRIELSPTLSRIRVVCQPVQISQVLLNLIANACDAIRASPDRWIRVEAETDANGQAKILVTDSGKGIPEAVRAKLFQPFFTTKDVGQGTGLGLSISRGILEAHHGSLEIDAACPNTRFVLRLPQAPAAEATPPKRAA